MEPKDRVEAALGSRDPGPREGRRAGGWVRRDQAGSLVTLEGNTKRRGHMSTRKASSVC